MDEDLKRIKAKLEELLSQENGYFGRIYTWGQRPTDYEYVGYVLSEPIDGVLEGMSVEERQKLVRILFHFEIHAAPLKKLLRIEPGEHNDLFSDIAWSHFMTVIMFGMLEVAAKDTSFAVYRGSYLNKQESIVRFLEGNLPDEVKADIADRYKVEQGTSPLEEKSFSGVVRHLWHEIRSGFVHEAGIGSKGMEWHTLSGGMGSEEDPIQIGSDVPMQELLQITWQAILNSFGYKGTLELPRRDRGSKTAQPSL
jgi:hypothetical protein